MATYTFQSVTGGRPKFHVDSGLWHIITNNDTIDPLDSTRIIMRTHNGQYIVSAVSDIVIIDGTTHAANSLTIDQLYDLLNPVFFDAGASASTTGDNSWTDTNGDTWAITGVTTSGALITSKI